MGAEVALVGAEGLEPTNLTDVNQEGYFGVRWPHGCLLQGTVSTSLYTIREGNGNQFC